MAYKILKEGVGLTAIYLGECPNCHCVFEFDDKEVVDKNEDQREGTFLHLHCPQCGNYFSVRENVVRRE